MRSGTKYIRTLTLWLAFAWASVSPLAIIAQPSSDPQNLKFRPVSCLDEITAEGAYLVGAEYEVNANGLQNTGFCLLTNLKGSSTLLGREVPNFSNSILEVADDCCIWNLRQDGGAYSLYSPGMQQGIALKKKSSTSLVMSAGDWEKWQLSAVGDGLFVLQSQTDPSRALGLNWYSSDKIYFGVYKTTGNNPTQLRIYKQIVSAVDLPGEAVMPADGNRVALVVNHQALVSSATGADWADIAPYILENNTLAGESNVKSWICHQRDNGAFNLTDADGKGLETVVEQLPAQMAWKVDNGHFVTTEKPARYLVQTANGGLCLMSRDEAEEKNPAFPLFIPFGEAPRFTLSEQGVKVLTGGWNVQQLADVDWSGVQILDLTNLSLPKSAVRFSRRPENSNNVVYVAASTTVPYWSRWKNVVTCSPDGKGEWSSQSLLVDREAWYVDRDIKVGNRQLSYQRQAHGDGKWETIMVPFSAALPADFELAKLDRRGENGDLIFKKVKSIEANEPMLIRYNGAVTDGKVNLELFSKEGWLTPYHPSATSLSGTYFPVNVTAEHSGIYLLNASGDTFLRAAAGSYLAPFRAAFFEDTHRSTVRLTFVDDEAAGLTPSANEYMGHCCYTIDGLLVTKNLQVDDWHRLPKGAYIIGGKKYLK